MEHSQESKDEIEKAVIEERSKPLPRVEAQKWAKSHPDTTCKICKEHNLPCAPLESRVHCNTPACRNSDKACSKYDDELFKRIVGRFPSLQRSAFDEILSRLPPLSLSDLNPALVAARTSSAPEPSPNKSTVSFKQKTPPTNPAPDSASEAAQLPPNFNPHAFYVGYSVSSTEPTLDPNLQSSFFDPSQVQVLAQKITDLLEENGALKAKLEEANSAEAVLNDSNQNLEKVKADTETMIQGLREALERTEAEHKGMVFSNIE
ncbi:uncharacterized protein BT62DRAFT_169117 [Guyanagaster necrorhizus]|uniref:Uncharacterized protein n=1 Tax=Guyanagaster necrorhizus TaxID=856835 RepID=A0A9P7VSG3_9AGAR|nr:uncharacterized protein BT62DRAFT_169117 [Guyanagaster necrorhizus MCA 3950]KAG7445635.1 hypothetical protein BT62DRAFT_169117 [Guyanagaster necrorhizus MCA 3950]